MLGSDPETFRVFLTKEVSPAADGLVYIDINNKMSFKKFLKKAGKKLGIKATRGFLMTSTGEFTEIKFIDEMKSNAQVVLTEGESIASVEQALNKSGSQEQLFISVLGAGGVGKSACALRFVRAFFVQDWDPTIEDAYRKNIQVDGRSCMLELLDTAGQDDFESLRPSWMMEKHGYVFVYSVNSQQSLDELDLFYNLHKQINGTNSNRIPIILVANKKDITDLDPKMRQVSIAKGRKKAEAFGAIHIETSAATGENVNEVFETLVREIRKRRAPSKPPGLAGRCCIL